MFLTGLCKKRKVFTMHPEYKQLCRNLQPILRRDQDTCSNDPTAAVMLSGTHSSPTEIYGCHCPTFSSKFTQRIPFWTKLWCRNLFYEMQFTFCPMRQEMFGRPIGRFAGGGARHLYALVKRFSRSRCACAAAGKFQVQYGPWNNIEQKQLKFFFIDFQLSVYYFENFAMNTWNFSLQKEHKKGKKGKQSNSNYDLVSVSKLME